MSVASISSCTYHKGHLITIESMPKLTFECIVVLSLIIENIMDFVVISIYEIRCSPKKIIGTGLHIVV